MSFIDQMFNRLTGKLILHLRIKKRPHSPTSLALCL